MKKALLFLCISSTFTFLLISCNDNVATKGVVSEEDSLRIISNYKQTLQLQDTLIKPTFFSFKDERKFIPEPLPIDSAQKMVTSYLTFHDLRLVGDNGQQLKGFILKAEDYARISKKGYKTISFYFGVHNFTNADNRTEQPKYTLLVVPIKQDGTAAKDDVFDYVLPCPTNCPTDGFERVP
ncbi:MAG: hypothetical protein QM731_18190 [Chitinophagaceae bacterium]